ncbi:MAG: hypothetical protein EP344_00285 [Bacteroidetes bacterium]|nr:MAG: hypothetical protein EP344_00285 [Bacteroidota bacterium]
MEKEKALRLLAENALEQLFILLRQNFPDKLGEVAIMEGNWSALQQQIRTGVLTQEQIAVAEARIRRDLRDFIEQPSGQSVASGQRSRLWLLAGIVAIFIFAGWLAVSLKKPDKATPLSATESDGLVSPVYVEDTISKSLPVSGTIIRLHAQYEGAIAYQLLQAELRSGNRGWKELHLKLRCIRPEFGKDVSASVVHLNNGTEEIAPYRVLFPFVDPNTTGDGSLYFKVPGVWENADILIYHGVADAVQQASIPLKLN